MTQVPRPQKLQRSTRSLHFTEFTELSHRWKCPVSASLPTLQVHFASDKRQSRWETSSQWKKIRTCYVLQECQLTCLSFVTLRDYLLSINDIDRWLDSTKTEKTLELFLQMTQASDQLDRSFHTPHQRQLTDLRATENGLGKTSWTYNGDYFPCH